MRFLTSLFLLTTLGLGILAWRQHHEVTVLTAKNALLEKERDALSRTARLRVEGLLDTDLSSRPTGLPADLLAQEAEAQKKKEEAAEPPRPGDLLAKPEAKKATPNPFSEIMKDGDQFRQRITARLKLEYGDFFDLMNLSAERRDAFYKTLVDQQWDILPLCVILAEPASTPAQRETALASIDTLSTKAKEQVKTAMSDSWPRLESFIATSPEREQIREFLTALEDYGITLPVDKENALLDICARQRAAWKFTRDLSATTFPVSAHYQPEALSLYINELTSLYAAIRKEAEPLLSKEQNEALTTAHTRLIDKAGDARRLLEVRPALAE